jgi:hypothetical protein
MNSRPAHRFGLLALADTAALAFAASAVWPASAATFRFERNVVPGGSAQEELADESGRGRAGLLLMEPVADPDPGARQEHSHRVPLSRARSFSLDGKAK